MNEDRPHNQGKAGMSGRCPICGKETAPDFRPFCSRRCRQVDLNRWLSGVYRVETDETPENTEGLPPGQAGD